MKLSPWKVFVRSTMVCGLLGTVIFGLSLRKIEPLPLSGGQLQFNAQSAYNYMAHLAKNFPNRTTWSENRKKAAAWIKNEFANLGYTPRGMQFSEVIAGKKYTDLENIYAEKRGTQHPDEIIVAMAHYDITDTTIEGAMDDASGVGVVLELARIFAHIPTDRTLIFLITDSEEFGSFWGARAFAKSFPRVNQIVATANFDFVAPEKQTKILTLCDGLKSGFTPLWLRELALDSLRSVGNIGAADMTNIVEFIQRAIQIPAADHGAFLAEGIPAFNWVGQTDNFAHEMAHFHHTRFDVVEAMEPQSFDSYGKGAERLIRSVDELPKIPDDFRNSSYWKVTKRLYIDGWAVTVLHILAFIPFLIYCVSKFSITLKNQPRERIILVLKNEMKNFGILLGSLLLGYVIMLLLPTLEVITQYEAFPATQKSLLLYTPNLIAILLVVGSVIGVYYIFRMIFAEPEDSLDHGAIRHAFHAAFLAIIIFLAFLKNSYLALLLLLPPAYFWTAIRSKKRLNSRIINMLLLSGGAITFVAAALVMSSIFHVGVMYWYLFLSATYGLISAYSVVLFSMALAVMIRLFKSFVI